MVRSVRLGVGDGSRTCRTHLPGAVSFESNQRGPRVEGVPVPVGAAEDGEDGLAHCSCDGRSYE